MWKSLFIFILLVLPLCLLQQLLLLPLDNIIILPVKTKELLIFVKLLFLVLLEDLTHTRGDWGLFHLFSLSWSWLLCLSKRRSSTSTLARDLIIDSRSRFSIQNFSVYDWLRRGAFTLLDFRPSEFAQGRVKKVSFSCQCLILQMFHKQPSSKRCHALVTAWFSRCSINKTTQTIFSVCPETKILSVHYYCSGSLYLLHHWWN